MFHRAVPAYDSLKSIPFFHTFLKLKAATTQRTLRSPLRFRLKTSFALKILIQGSALTIFILLRFSISFLIPQRMREPSAKALEAIATYNIQEQIEDEGEQDPKASKKQWRPTTNTFG